MTPGIPSRDLSGTVATITFFLVSAVAILGALVVLFTKDMVRAAGGLFLALIGVAGLFLLLRAGLPAAFQMLVSVAGIATVLLFGVALLGGPDRLGPPRPAATAVAAAIFLLLLIALPMVVAKAHWFANGSAASAAVAAPLGASLLAPVLYLAPFELIGVVLLVALVGAAYLARGRRK